MPHIYLLFKNVKSSYAKLLWNKASFSGSNNSMKYNLRTRLFITLLFAISQHFFFPHSPSSRALLRPENTEHSCLAFEIHKTLVKVQKTKIWWRKYQILWDRHCQLLTERNIGITLMLILGHLILMSDSSIFENQNCLRVGMIKCFAAIVSLD